MKLDFYASQPHFIDHLKPIWEAFPQRGRFFVPEELHAYNAVESVVGLPSTIYPVLVASYGDFVTLIRDHPQAKIILMEHGIGMTFGTPAYADGYGRRANVAMFLVQSQYVANKFDPRIIAPRRIIGIPKLDKWAGEFEKPHPMPEKPTIGISFHHSNFASIPEAQNAWDYYLPILPELAKRYKVIGTGHPMEMDMFSETYRKLGIEIVENFEELMRRADILLFDCTSAGYEFLVTGKPVVVLNCPKFRRDKEWGIRFWDYSHIGPQVDTPDWYLFRQIEFVQEFPVYIQQRRNAINDLIPNLGHATEKAVKALVDFIATLPDPSPVIASSEMQDGGIMYMCFGERARQEIGKSIASMHELGMDYPVVVVGDTPVGGTSFIEWEWENPFDLTRPKGLQFLSGRVKPLLYRLSPFQRTLYTDADTRFKSNISRGFEYLTACDLAVAEENQVIKDLRNPDNPSISWYHHMPEVQATIAEIGSGNVHFLNSGVIFFRKSHNTEKLFDTWYSEWQKWRQWDEQAALLRAITKSEAKVKRLDIAWNCPHPKSNIFIYHCCARGAARAGGI